MTAEVSPIVQGDDCECGHPVESHGDWNWPVKCLFGPCDCRISGASLRGRLDEKGSTRIEDGVHTDSCLDCGGTGVFLLPESEDVCVACKGTGRTLITLAAAEEEQNIERIDRYTITINGLPCRATEDQERRIRAMNPEDLSRFAHIMRGPR